MPTELELAGRLGAALVLGGAIGLERELTGQVAGLRTHMTVALGAALFGTFLGCALLLPVYAIGGMGAGDVKMTMGFGSWMGAFFSFTPGMWIIVYALCAGTIVGGIIALGMIVVVSGARAAVVTRIAMELTVVLVAILVLKVAVTISVAAAACLDRRTSASDGAVTARCGSTSGPEMATCMVGLATSPLPRLRSVSASCSIRF